MLMETTSDLEAFENKIKNVDMNVDVDNMYDKDAGDLRSISRPEAGDLSTLRTLIANLNPRLQSKLMTKMQEQRKNGLGAMGGSIKANFEKIGRDSYG